MEAENIKKLKAIKLKFDGENLIQFQVIMRKGKVNFHCD
jgi:hypothetical protein